MKRLITVISFLYISLLAFAQGPLKFLGIPIDGPEAQFISQLKGKGFLYDSANNRYKGQFNGHTVSVYIHSNHNLMDRVYVAFPTTTSLIIREQFNRLLSQFNESPKYLTLSINTEIPNDEDIAYEISVNKKRYQAIYSYFDSNRDSEDFVNGVLETFSDYFTDEQLAKLKEYYQESKDLIGSDFEEFQGKLMEEMQSMGLGQKMNAETDPVKAYQSLLRILGKMRSLADGEVWFMIHGEHGRYNLGLYYDNLHNRPHGEDL